MGYKDCKHYSQAQIVTEHNSTSTRHAYAGVAVVGRVFVALAHELVATGRKRTARIKNDRLAVVGGAVAQCGHKHLVVFAAPRRGADFWLCTAENQGGV